MKSILRKTLSVLLALCLLTVLFPLGVRAESTVHVWTGTADNNWNNGGNWDTGVVPGSGDTAVIPSGKEVNIASGTVNVCLQNEGNLTIQSEAILELANGSELKAGRVLGEGLIRIEDGTTTWSGGTIEGNALLVVTQPTATLKVTGDDKTMPRNVTSYGKIHVAVDYGKKLTFTNTYTENGTLQVTGAGMVEFSGAYAFNIKGDIDDAGNCAYFTASNNATVTFGKSYNVKNTYVSSNATATWAALDGGTERTFGLVSITGGTAIFNGDASCLLKLHSGTVTGSGNITLRDQSEWTAGIILGTGNLTVPSGATLTLQGDGTKSSDRNLMLSGILKSKIGSSSYAAASTTGSITLNEGSSLHVELLGGYVPADNSKLSIIGCPNSPEGNFSSVTSNNSDLTLSYEYATEPKPPHIAAVVRRTPPVDTTPPVWEAGYPQATDVAATGFTLVSKTDESGSIYYIVLAQGATAPTSAEVKIGTSAIKYGTAALTVGSECSCTISGLTAATDYDVYVVAEDSVGNLQTAPVKLEVATAAIVDTTPPQITAHAPESGAVAVEVTTSTLTLTFDEPVWGVAGKQIKINRVDGVSTPTIATIDVGSEAVTGQGTATITVTLPEKTLTYEKSYNVIIDAGAFQDAANNLSAGYGGPLQWGFTTEAIWSPNYPVLGNIQEGFGGVWIDVYANSPRFATAYCVVTKDSSAPSSQQVKEGKGRNGAFVPGGHFASGTINDTVRELQLMYLEPDSEYYVYVILEDVNGIMTLPKQLTLRTLLTVPDTPFWNQRSPSPTINSLQKVVYAAATSTEGRGFYALGTHGALAYSSDGVTWSKRNTYTSFNMTGLTPVHAVYFAVANDGNSRSLLLSSDAAGVTWFHKLVIQNARISDLIYAKNLLVAVADGGKIIVWPDLNNLHNYTRIQLADTQNLNSITYAGDTFVAVGQDGVVATSTDGYNWTAQQLSPKRDLVDVTYANGKLVAIGTGYLNNTYAFWSTNKGSSWTGQDFTSSVPYQSVMHDGTKFVAIGYGNVATSSDAISWTFSTPDGLRSHVVNAAGFANGKFIVAGGYGGNISTSTNLNDWSHVTQGVTKQLASVAWGNSCFAAIGESGTIVTSSDGVKWQAQNSGTTKALEKVRYLNNQFIAVGSKQTILTSPDGTVWTVRKSEETSNGLVDVAYGAGKYIAVGVNGTMFSSGDNGVTWTAVSLGTYPSFNAITYGGGWFVALGNLGQVLRSNDGGETWIASYAKENYAQDLIYQNGRFMAIGPTYGQYSDDGGATWDRVRHGISSYIYSLVEKDGRLIAVGQNGSIICSLDNGASWTKQEFPNDISTQVRDLRGVVAGPNNFVTVGNYGLILQSTGFGPGPNLDAQAVAAAKAALTWDVIKGVNTDMNQVTANLVTPLPALGEQGTNITWSVSPAGYVLLTGEVIRPDAETGDKNVTLTAFISKGAASDSKVFNLTVISEERTDAEAVAADKALLTWDLIDLANEAEGAVTSDLFLPASGLRETTITWTAEPTGYVDTTSGAVTRPPSGSADVAVTLTATVSKGEVSDTVVFNLVVKALPALSADEAIGLDAEALTDAVIRGANTTLNQVTSSLNLPAAGANGTTIGWAAAPTYYVNLTTGAITRPEHSQGNQTVTLTATISKEGGISQTKTFTITITKAAPSTAYTVTVNGSYASTTGAGSYAQGATVTISAGSRNSYTFAGWTSPNGVAFTNANNATTTFTMPDKNVTITANWSYDGGGGGSTPTTPAAPAYKADVKEENGTETTLPVTVDKDAGTASVDAGSRNLDQSGTIITIPSVPDVDTYSVGIPVPDLSTSDVQGTLTVKTDAGSVTIPSNMLTGVSGVSGSKAEIAIGQGDKDNLPDAVKAAIGDRPLVQLTLSIDGKRTDWSNPDAPVTVSIPYTPTAAELANPESIVVWYIDGSGNAVSVPNGYYDPATGMVTFTTTHFSDYAVAYNKVSFNDVAADAWYHKAVSFIAARGITGGTGNGNYSPEVKLTRGQFIVMLMKAYGIAADADPKNNFADAGATYYTGYLAAAKRLGISAGIGNNMFAPEKEITRQEMFTLLYNALKVIGHLPQGDSDKTLDYFSDAGQIDSWAKEAMILLVKTGTVGGSNGKLSPLNTTTRAEMAQVLYNLLGK